MSLFHFQSADSIPLPYNAAVCRKAIYQLLLTLLMSSFSWKPSPDQVLVKTFSLGVNDQDIEVFLSENFIVDSYNKSGNNQALVSAEYILLISLFSKVLKLLKYLNTV